MTRADVIRRLTELPEAMANVEALIFAATWATLAAKKNLEEVTASLYLSGSIDGRNSEMREAQILLQTVAARDHVRTCEMEEANQKRALRDLDREFGALRAIARLLREGDE